MLGVFIRFREYGKHKIGRKCNPYAPTVRKNSYSVNIIRNDILKWCLYHAVIVASILGLTYCDACKELSIKYIKDENNNQTDNIWSTSNLRVFGHKVYQIISAENIATVTKSSTSEQEKLANKHRVEAFVKLGAKQVLPTDLFDGKDFYPLRQNYDTEPLFYVGQEGVLSIGEYAKKMAGGQYVTLNASIASDRYVIISTKIDNKPYTIKLHRIVVASALSITSKCYRRI